MNFSRTERRRIAFGLATLLGIKRLGFFIPYRFAERLPVEDGTMADMAELFEAYSSIFLSTLNDVSAFVGELLARPAEASPAPRFDQDWFAPLDAAIAYGLVRQRAPSVILEIGAGHSTRFMAQAIRDSGRHVRHLVIEPEPSPAVRQLAREGRIELFYRMVHEVKPDALPATFESGDILSLDGSHILMPGTDTDIVFRSLCPRLQPGALFHVHDVFLPDPYPAAWAWRGYNEQNMLASLIAVEFVLPIFSSHYVVSRLSEALMVEPYCRLPGARPAPPSSFWGVRA